jgi:hypothetical protein
MATLDYTVLEIPNCPQWWRTTVATAAHHLITTHTAMIWTKINTRHGHGPALNKNNI